MLDAGSAQAPYTDSLSAELVSCCRIQMLTSSLKHWNLEVSMAISQDLLEILACPACKAKVELKPDGSGLKCVQCRRVYPIRDDIPVMLIEEATVEDEEAKS